MYSKNKIQLRSLRWLDSVAEILFHVRDLFFASSHSFNSSWRWCCFFNYFFMLMNGLRSGGLVRRKVWLKYIRCGSIKTAETTRRTEHNELLILWFCQTNTRINFTEAHFWIIIFEWIIKFAFIFFPNTHNTAEKVRKFVTINLLPKRDTKEALSTCFFCLSEVSGAWAH